MGFFDRVRNLFSGRGFQDSPAPAPAQREERAPEPQRQEQERGWFERLRDRLTGEDVRREEAERTEQERQAREQERQERESLRQELERQRQELERERADLARERQERAEQDRLERERLEGERQELERQRQELERERAERAEQERLEQERAEQERLEQERQQVEQERAEQERQAIEQRAIDEWNKLGIPDVTGGKDGGAKWTIYGCRTPDELRGRLDEAAAAGRRVSIKVHDKNGWHDLYVNSGRYVPGGAGISAGELRDRFARAGVPGEHFTTRGGTSSGGISPEPGAGMPEMESDNDIVGEPGEVLDGPEWDYPEEDDEGFDDSDYYDYVDASDGGDDSETEGYDPASVNGYQLVVY